MGRLPPIRLLHRHPRLLTAAAAGLVVFLFLPASQPLSVRMLIGWDCGVTLFLIVIYLWMQGSTPEQICSHYLDEDPSAAVILVAVTAAALLSLVGIIQPLVTMRHLAHDQRVWRFALAAVTLIDSWLLVPTMFTMHYADLFYSAPPGNRPLQFPRTEMPGFWDFAYFSITIAAATQTADVSTTTTSIRRVVILQEIISFAFNIAVLGFAINITAGLVAS